MKSNPIQDPKAEPGQRQLTEQMVKGEKGLLLLKSSLGVEKYYAYAPISSVNWSLAVSAPVAEITGSVSSLSTISLITIVIVLVIAGMIIIWYARRIAKPIKTLEIAANRIAAGDISINKLNITSNDEIGRLGQAFEKMTENLRGLIHKITQATDHVASSSEELTASAEE